MIIVAACLLIAGTMLVVVPRVQHFLEVRKAEQLLQRSLPSVSLPRPNPNPNPLAPPLDKLGVNAVGSPKTEVNLPVPFTVQAPLGNWDMPYPEACEEAASVMVLRYVFGNPILSLSDADAAILNLVHTNESILHFPVDETAEQVGKLLLSVEPKLTVRLKFAPTLEQLKRELSAGNVIIVPAAGEALQNPFFRRPGPRYHMLVLRGYTADGYFITNDPGTKRGEGYLYPYSRIMEAMADWNPALQQADASRKVVVVIEPLEGMKK